jgi:hypothetical protein
MNNFLRSLLAIIAGVLTGSLVNMAVITFGTQFIPAPAGVDMTELDSIKASMHLFEAKHFIIPFLSHSLGTFVGAFVTAFIVRNNQMTLALIIGVFFLIGGVASAVLLPVPYWFAVVDLILAYIPMAWLGWKLSDL